MYDKLTKKGLVNRLGGSVYIWSGSEIILHVTAWFVICYPPRGFIFCKSSNSRYIGRYECLVNRLGWKCVHVLYVFLRSGSEITLHMTVLLFVTGY